MCFNVFLFSVHNTVVSTPNTREMEPPNESKIELESFIKKSTKQTENQGPPYDAKLKTGRNSFGLSLQRAYFWICRQNRLLTVVILFILGNFAKNSASIYNTKRKAGSAYISFDYSNVGSVDDLTTITARIDDFCFVS